ncbi:DNA-3-methyladenine glycosylase I [Pseudenhygromyxa sp. WMMC2535]|uniref:DNA-3-methyladenine glycosylase I n=1 Tax=Pseudenhygromyxa sp. WMMC2535 TaxID=2712867 RepID=UPI00155490FC|nr:DNA-3-methyladenine glycosylase I [Pseudenhygromyxa sp. WMMC2535]NVB42844.1 DNA-3-methyladenine glycosylase I [Pseudenhygromyxa sp. WMMC2535]
MAKRDGLITHDGITRCWWCGELEDYQRYHDEEWGFPVDDDHRLFEKLCLEGFQSGLSWLTILRKREGFRRAFANFDFEAIARWRPASRTEKLLANADIVRHRGKIEATLSNARQACALAEEYGSLAAYFWRWEPDPSERPRKYDKASLAALGQTPSAKAMAKDLEARGFRFFGPTTAYAFMQAMGMVNDHLEGCATRPEVEAARAAFKRPS